MPLSRILFVMLAIAALGLSACSRKEPNLMNLRSSSSGPDEFAILPTKEIVIPTDLASLPEPTLGGSNRSDPTPKDDAIIALGGNPSERNGLNIPSGDQGIVSVASRYGVAGDIREQLAVDDYEFRSKNRGRLLERLFGQTTYYSAYEKQALDRYRELRRLRRSGVRTPAAPPKPAS